MALGRALPYTQSVKFLVFADDQPEPSWILRCHHDASIAAREVLVLGELQRRGYRLQPEMVGYGSCEDLHALLLRFRRARHGNVVWRRPEAIDQLMSALARVQTDLASWAASKFESRTLHTAHLCGAIQRAGGVATNETQLVRTLEQAREMLVRANAPALPQHGDCCVANLLWNEGNITLLDWEHFAFAFEPFLDVWIFALSLCEESGDPHGESLFGTGPNATAAECAVRRYASSVNLTAEIGRQVFPLAVARLIDFNDALGRIETAGRMCGVLHAYLADSTRFMRGLQR